jgi:hypothetical protein
MRAALDDHYAQHPEARPDLADIAIAAAEIDGNPLASDPERIRRAAAEIAATHPDPEPEDVLLWAEARAFPTSFWTLRPLIRPPRFGSRSRCRSPMLTSVRQCNRPLTPTSLWSRVILRTSAGSPEATWSLLPPFKRDEGLG